MPSLWQKIWLIPRPTIRHIVDSDPNQQLPLLVFLGGISHALSTAASLGMGETLSLASLVGFCLIFGPLSAFLTLRIGGRILRWTTAKFGGTATVPETRAALAWSWVPIISILPLWIVRYILFRDELFKLETPHIDSVPQLSFLYNTINLIEFAIVVWGALILYSALAEINRFSAWRSFFSVVLSILIVLLPLQIVAVLVGQWIG
ncbi:YIP1 family protein [candidate division KSB1 bacterium]|nr:YIP1 family protein [candidate division KSB1 bacterium]